MSIQNRLTISVLILGLFIEFSQAQIYPEKEYLNSDGQTIDTYFISDDHSLIVIGSEMVRILDAATGDTIQTIDLKGKRARSLSLSPDNQKLLIGLDRAKVKLWDVNNNVEEYTFETSTKNAIYVGGPAPVVATAFHPNNNIFATEENYPAESYLQIWDMINREELLRVMKHTPVERLIFSKDGRYLLERSLHDSRVISTETGKILLDVSGAGGVLSDDSNSLYIVNAGSNPYETAILRKYDINSGNIISTSYEFKTFGSYIEVLPNGKYLLALDESETSLVILDIKNNDITHTLENKNNDEIKYHSFWNSANLVYALSGNKVYKWKIPGLDSAVDYPFF